MEGHSTPTVIPTDAAREEWESTAQQANTAETRERLVKLGMGSVVGEPADDGLGSSHEIDESDGRSMRRARNRDAVIVSLLLLIREGSLDPSVADIAERAGVSHRSVFRYFDDINDLVRLAIDHEVREAMPLTVIADIGQGSLQRRIDSYVDSRLRLYAQTDAVARVARLKAPKIPALEEGLKVLSGISRKQMAQHFAPECESQPDNCEFLLDALMVITNFEAYDYQRRMLGYGVERIRQVWHIALAAQLTAHAPTD